MEKNPQKEIRALTIEYNRLSRVLYSDIEISVAFDPSKEEPTKKSKYKAIWDTGATGTVISKKVAVDLGLKPISMAKVKGVNSESIVPVYYVNVYLPNKVSILFVRVTEGLLGDVDVLIGMDIISLGDFAISNFNGKTIFSFRVPSEGDIKFTDKKTKIVKREPYIKPEKKIGRNDPCWCGSGKKYKNCHGKNF